MRRALTALAVVAALAGAAVPARAQDSSAHAVAAHFTTEQAAAFSKQVERDLAAKGARVAMVFRAGRGRDQLPEGISYTHGAFWVYRTIKTADGQELSGYAVYNLYAGDGKAWPTIESRLVQDFPLDFTRGSTVNDMAVGIWGTDDPDRIALDLKAHYKPTIVKANAVLRFFGPIADKRLRTDDQNGPIRTATYESLAAFMKDNGLLQESYIFNYQP